MTRTLPSWAQARRGKPRPALTLPGDLVQAARGVLLHQRPAGAPPKPRVARDLGLRTKLTGRHLSLRLMSLRFDIEIVGAGNLDGVRQPLVFAANEQGVLDYQLLRLALPSRLRPTMIAPSRALARGRNVVVFTDEPAAGRIVGEFSTVAAGLANQHNVAIVPVGLVGTFKLKDILKLPVTTRPKVSIRFGAPIYVRGRHLAEATARTQESVEQLVLEGDLTWWTVERRRVEGLAPVAGRPAPRWRRLWDQAAPTGSDRGRIWG
ncbi:MAG: hypothetical protein QM713_01635 [Arachnia sp.]